MSSKDTQFKKGNSGGPGRPKSGRTLALNTLDKMLAKRKNVRALEKSLQEEFDKNPADFFKKIVMPLAPKDINLLGEMTIKPQKIKFGDEEVEF